MGKSKLLAVTGVAFIVGPVLMLPAPHQPVENQSHFIGDVNSLAAKYDRWKTNHEKNGGATKLVLGLGYDKALSREYSAANGKMTLDFTNGAVQVEVSGLDSSVEYDVWFVDNIPGEGKSAMPEVGDQMVRIGSLAHDGTRSVLDTRVASDVLAGGDLDLVVVTRAGDRADEGGLLYGTPQLFQRLYYSERRGDLANFIDRTDAATSAPDSVASYQFLVPGVAYANNAQGASIDSTLQSLVALGEDLFFNETFDGNGRTCGTCHPAENNFTIDPIWIASLPPNDPLFVAEFNPDLADLENPTLMRQLGLILENKDGFDAPAVFRSPTHMLGLQVTIEGETNQGGDPFPFAHAVGWAGDGGGPTNTIRGFGSGAVAQHAPKTLNRVAGVDFRVATETELDAMEAFMFSIGRDFEYDLDAMQFSSPLVEFGKELFNSREAPAKCGRCHDNGGANSSTTGQNGQRNTGVEDLPSQLDHLLAEVEGLDLACDGGFGKGDGTFTRVDGKQGLLVDDCSKACNGGLKDGGCGDGTFNITTVIEAADTAPFFHNNAATTLEEAIEFYNSDAFNNSPAAIGEGGIGTIHMETSEVSAIALFLRTVNAVENLRIAKDYNFRAAILPKGPEKSRFTRLAIAELEDAVEVLKGAVIITNPDAIKSIKAAIKLLEKALQGKNPPPPPPKFNRGIHEDADLQIDLARADLVVEDPV